MVMAVNNLHSCRFLILHRVPQRPQKMEDPHPRPRHHHRRGPRRGRQRSTLKLNRPPANGARAPRAFAGTVRGRPIKLHCEFLTALPPSSLLPPPSLPPPWRRRNIQECNSCTFASASMIFSLSRLGLSRAIALRKAAALERENSCLLWLMCKNTTVLSFLL